LSRFYGELQVCSQVWGKRQTGKNRWKLLKIIGLIISVKTALVWDLPKKRLLDFEP
jgi:hypothetical protein